MGNNIRPKNKCSWMERADEESAHLDEWEDIWSIMRLLLAKIDGSHRLVTSRATASMRTTSYETRIFFFRQRNSREPWVVRGLCECKNGRSARCAHVVATLLVVSKLQHPDDHRIPWQHAPPTRSIYAGVRLVKKRKNPNRPVVDHTGFEMVARKRKTIA